MTRPKDFGDPLPGDPDDILPGSPTEGFSERDYNTDSGSSSIPFEALETFAVAPTDRVPEQERPVYTGFVAKHITAKDKTPRRYWVQRDDGALGVARALESIKTLDFYPGDPVVLVRGPNTNDWIIVGRGTPQELTQFEIKYVDSPLKIATPKILPFNLVSLDLPDRNNPVFGGSGDFDLQADGTVKCNTTGMFNINYTIQLSADQTDNDSCSPIIAIECPPDPLPEQTDSSKPGKIVFDKSLGFKIRHDSVNCISYIGLESTVPDSIQNYSADKARWVQNPKIGGSVSIATQNRGWLKIGNPATYAWLTNKETGKIKLTLPSAGSGILFAESFAGECVQLGWLPVGKTGTLAVATQIGTKTCTSYGGYSCVVPVIGQYQIFVKKGLIIGDSAGYLQNDSESASTPNCELTDSDQQYKPCETEG